MWCSGVCGCDVGGTVGEKVSGVGGTVGEKVSGVR